MCLTLLFGPYQHNNMQRWLNTEMSTPPSCKWYVCLGNKHQETGTPKGEPCYLWPRLLVDPVEELKKKVQKYTIAHGTPVPLYELEKCLPLTEKNLHNHNTGHVEEVPTKKSHKSLKKVLNKPLQKTDMPNPALTMGYLFPVVV